MSEYLKNNPTVLHHCLLYDFLYEFPPGYHILDGYGSFRKVVGSDVISLDDFEFWFSRFKEGKLYDDEEPLLEILPNNKYALRACILYESLRCQPNSSLTGIRKRFAWLSLTPECVEIQSNVYKAYKRLCKAFGDDVIKYQEFDFWYYRFANGLFDLDFEPDPKKKILELGDIPMEIVEKVVETLDYFDRCAVRKVSKPLRDLVDTTKCTMKKLEILLHKQFTSIKIDDTKIGYSDGFNVRDTQKTVKGKKHWKHALNDIRILFKNSKFKLKHFEICVRSNIDSIDSIFKYLKFQVHVEHLEIKSHFLKFHLQLLPYLKPRVLEKITTHAPWQCKEQTYITYPWNDCIEDMGRLPRIVETEQWKQAKHFQGPRHTRLPMEIENLFHFETFYLKWSDFDSLEMEAIKDILFKSPHFTQCLLGYDVEDEGYSMRIDGIKRVIGLNPISTVPFHVYHYPIPDSKEYFEIQLRRRHISITRQC